MKCSKILTCEFTCDEKIVPPKFSALIGTGLVKIMEGNSIPISIASKVSDLLDDTLDAADFCNVVSKQQESIPHPKRSRMLDRVIVHHFELLYDRLMSEMKKRNRKNSSLGSFFNIVPRGECLNLFLEVIRNYCIGNDEFQKYHVDIEMLTRKHSDNGVINWHDIYSSDEYKHCIESLFSLFFNHIKQGSTPIPALNTQMNKRYQPERINKVLRYLNKIWLLDRKKATSLTERS